MHLFFVFCIIGELGACSVAHHTRGRITHILPARASDSDNFSFSPPDPPAPRREPIFRLKDRREIEYVLSWLVPCRLEQNQFSTSLTIKAKRKV